MVGKVVGDEGGWGGEGGEGCGPMWDSVTDNFRVWVGMANMHCLCC